MKELIKQLKFNRLKPEEKIIVSILNNGLFNQDKKFINYFNLKGVDSFLIFEYNTTSKTIYCSYKRFWNQFNKFDLTTFQKNKLLKTYIELYLNIEVEHVKPSFL